MPNGESRPLVVREKMIAIMDTDASRAARLMELLPEVAGGSLLVASVPDAAHLASLARAGKPDYLLVDARGTWNGLSGIDVVAQLDRLAAGTQVIFIEGSPSAVPDIYRVDHAYLLPADPTADDLKIGLAHARRRRALHEASPLLLHAVTGDVRLLPDDIRCVQSRRRLMRIRIAEGWVEAYGRLSSLLDMLPDSFVQCHKSYLANLRHVVRATGSQLVLDTGDTVPVSQRRSALVREAVRQRMGREVR